MTQALRPPFILAFIADTAGCGHHRVMRPMEIMSRHGFCSGRVDTMLWPDDRLLAAAPDVVVFQRQLEEGQILAMERVRELLPKAFMVYEIDDIMSELPDWSPHKAYIPVDVDERMAKAINVCDAVTVTTYPLKHHIQHIMAKWCPDKSIAVRVVPNMLGKDELRRVEEVRNGNPPPKDKIRIGWGGGMAHGGDLELLYQAMREYHNRAEFVFLGMKPEIEIPVEFHQGVPPSDYLPRLASLRLNLILAPLTECKFNECKSNLRLLEAGAIGVPVIASPITPYTKDSPPVAYAATPQEWSDQIGKFINEPAKFEKYGRMLKTWMQSHFVLDDKVKTRLSGWLPADATPFVPRPKADVSGIILFSKDKASPNTRYEVTSDVHRALASDCDILYLRSGVIITDEQVAHLVERLHKPNVASVAPMTNDGGVASFPRINQFTPAESLPAAEIDKLCRENFENVEVEVSNPAGPVILLSRKALEVVGYPDFLFSEDDIEVALIEWGINAVAKGYSHKIVAGAYCTVMFPHPGVQNAQRLMARCALRYPKKEFPNDPLTSIRAELELLYHKNFYRSPLPSMGVTYAEWESLFGILGERDMAWLQDNRPTDVTVEHVTYPTTVDALKRLTSQWIVMTAETTKLADHALLLFEREISEFDNKYSDMLIYADHDHVMPAGMYDNHDFKPHRIDKHLLLQRDYLTQVFAVKVSWLLEGCSLDKTLSDNPPILNEVELYRRLTQMVWTGPSSWVRHIPRVLAHVVQPDAKTMLENCDLKSFAAMAVTTLNVKPSPRWPALGEISYASKSRDAPVLIIMPTGGKMSLLQPCLQSLLNVTNYENYKVVVVENGVRNPDASAYLDELCETNDRVLRAYVQGEYNWSALNNHIAGGHHFGDYLLFLNDDTRFIEPDWLAEMVGAAEQPNVGAVGARLLYPHGMVQHIGVVARRGLSGHLLKNIPESSPGYNGIAVCSHQSTAVTGAVMLVSRLIYEGVGGFNEELAHNFNDVAFCLELNRMGYVNVVAARCPIQHLEGATRINPNETQGADVMRAEAHLMAGLYKEEDPYWNDNLHFVHMQGGVFVSGLNCDMLEWPAKPWPWRTKEWPYQGVLIVGDDGGAWVRHSRNGDAPYFGMMNGFSMQIGRPPLVNLQPFDIRDSATPREVLAKLGISKIVIRSILGGTPESLGFFLKLGVPVEYMPFTGEAVCPRTDFKFQMNDGNLMDCDSGWRKGMCQECVSRCNSPFGIVSITGWRDYWRRFFEDVSAITVASTAAGEVLKEVYDIQVDI